MTTFPGPAVELPLAADRSGGIPLAGQIAGQLRAALAAGRLTAGERLPSSRALAATLGVSRTVVTVAYTQLFAEGWLEGRHGSGTYVAAGAAAPGVSASTDGADAAGGPAPGSWPGRPGPAPAVAGTGGDGLLANLRPGIPWTGSLDQAAWRRAWRRAAVQAPSGWPDPAGVPALRQAVSGYLRRARGVYAGAGQILPTRGVSAGLRLVAAALLRPGDRVGVEEPGYPAARAVFAARGAQVVPCRVDPDGLVVPDLPGGLRLVYTTPAHQYPLGGRLPVPRRQELLAWARATGAVIVEDDYDGEFRYDVAPLPALFGLDPRVVIYLGTLSKALTPALGAGWLVARPSLVPVFAAAGAEQGERVPEPVQHAAADLLASGALERHVRRMRHEYARRRAVMTAVLSAVLSSRPGLRARLAGDTAGMHMVLELPAALAWQVAQAAQARGVAVSTLDRYFAGPAAMHGLVLGYGAADLAAVNRGCRVIAEILAALPADRAGAAGS